MDQCPSCNGQLRAGQNEPTAFRCVWCPTTICDWCYWKHTGEKHPNGGPWPVKKPGKK